MSGEIDNTIDYCKGRIKSFEKARKPLPFEKFDKNKCDNITKKIHRYKVILQVLEEKKQRDQGCGYCKSPYKDIIDIILGESENGDEVHLFINTDGQNLRLYDNLPDNPKTDTLKIGYCPMCGRRLCSEGITD